MRTLSSLIICFLWAILLFFPQKVFSQDTTDNRIRFGLCGEFNIGYHNIGSNDLREFDREGSEGIGQTGLFMTFSGGVDAYYFNKFQISFFLSYSYLGASDSYSGFGFKWKNALGSGADIPMALNIFDFRLELQFTRPIKHNLFPFFGIGRTLSYSLTDDGGSGFIDGGGGFHFSLGTDISCEKGFWRLFKISPKIFSGYRIGIILRPSFAFKKFKLGNESIPAKFRGNSISIFLGMHLVSGLL